MSSTRTPVDDYLAALSTSLGGPRRRKADLLAEARDHLTDATEAFEAGGLERYDAERAAVADFGELRDVVPGYRAELAVSQSRRTAVLLFMVLIVQPIVWRDDTWTWNQEPAGPSPVNGTLDNLIEIVGMLSMLGAVLAVVVAGIGMRVPVVREHASRATALFALVSSAVISVIGVGLASTSTHPNGLLDYAVVSAVVVGPLIVVGLQAGRVLRLARA